MEKKKMQTVFKLKEYYIDKNEVVRYPVFDISEQDLGLFSSLKSAKAAMLKHISVRAEYEMFYCFFITGHSVDKLYSYYNEDTTRVYSPTGELIDECLVSELECKNFYGRPQEKIRFKVGDIVEVLLYDTVELGVVRATPQTPENIQERYGGIPGDGAGSDCYRVDSGDFEYGDFEYKDVDYHSHPMSCYLFAPRFPIPEDVKNKITDHINYQNKLEEEILRQYEQERAKKKHLNNKKNEKEKDANGF